MTVVMYMQAEVCMPLVRIFKKKDNNYMQLYSFYLYNIGVYCRGIHFGYIP